MTCIPVIVVVDRVEEDIAVLEVGLQLVEVPWTAGLEEGAELRLCVPPPPAAPSLPLASALPSAP